MDYSNLFFSLAVGVVAAILWAVMRLIGPPVKRQISENGGLHFAAVTLSIGAAGIGTLMLFCGKGIEALCGSIVTAGGIIGIAILACSTLQREQRMEPDDAEHPESAL